MRLASPDIVSLNPQQARLRVQHNCPAGDRETAEMLANKLKSDEARNRDAAAAEPPVP